MKRALIVSGVVAALLLTPATAPLQAQEEAPAVFAYGTYLECDNARQWRADEIVKMNIAVVYEEALESGVIKSWGYLKHHTGGKWRRVAYFTAPGIEGILEATEAINGKIAKEVGRAGDEFGEICGVHEDYIWRFGTGSEPGQARGDAAFSTYFKCDPSREARADELVEKVIGPLYDAQVEAGNLVGWGWLKHSVGGKWRRLATSTAADHKTMLMARSSIIEELVKSHADEMTEFNAICSSHQDYMWDVAIESP